MWVSHSTVYGTMNREAHKSRQRKSATSQPAAGSHGSLFLSTSLNFRTVNSLSLRARGELWRRSKLAQIRRRAPCACQARLQQGTTIVLPCCSLILPTHCAQPPEHHHRPASCHGELLLRPLARLSRWHTLAICCSRSASSSPHSCQGAVTAHLLAGLSRAGSPAGATHRPLSLVHHGPRRLLAAGARRQCAGTVEPEHRVLDASGVKSDLMWPNRQQ